MPTGASLNALKARRAEQLACSTPPNTAAAAARPKQEHDLLARATDKISSNGSKSSGGAGSSKPAGGAGSSDGAVASSSKASGAAGSSKKGKEEEEVIELAADAPAAAGPLTTTVLSHAWVCNSCKTECVPIRSESRCMCGHRLKDHAKLTSTSSISTCNVAKCACSGFTFIMAEGAWILKCQCKHKHTDHDPKTHSCNKPSCKCTKFFSPWVCNCDHPWGDHTQVVVERKVLTMEGIMAGMSLNDVGAGIAPDVNRHDMIRRGRE